jgi:hypothetical protein
MIRSIIKTFPDRDNVPCGKAQSKPLQRSNTLESMGIIRSCSKISHNSILWNVQPQTTETFRRGAD